MSLMFHVIRKHLWPLHWGGWIPVLGLNDSWGRTTRVLGLNDSGWGWTTWGGRTLGGGTVKLNSVNHFMWQMLHIPSTLSTLWILSIISCWKCHIFYQHWERYGFCQSFKLRMFHIPSTLRTLWILSIISCWECYIFHQHWKSYEFHQKHIDLSIKCNCNAKVIHKSIFLKNKVYI